MDNYLKHNTQKIYNNHFYTDNKRTISPGKINNFEAQTTTTNHQKKEKHRR